LKATRVPEGPGETPDRSPPRVPPLDLPRLVMRRAAAVAVFGVLLTLLLGLAAMRDDVDAELAGARTMALLAERLAALPALPDDQAAAALRSWRASGELRHLQLQVTAADGRVLWAQDAPAHLSSPMRWLAQAGARLFTPAPPFTVTWPLARPQGPPWTVTLRAAPESERVEALHALMEDVLLLAAVALGMLVVMAWNTRRAFEPLARLLAAIRGMERDDPAGAAGRVPELPAMPIAELETVAAALRHLDRSLAAAEARRRQLAQQVLSLQEDERSRLARELHDEFGQHLTALRVNAAWLQRRTDGDADLQPVVRDMAAQCAAIQQDIRAVLTRLRPLGPRDSTDVAGPAGESLGQLGRLLQDLVASWSRRPDQGTAHGLHLQLRAADGTALDWAARADRWLLPREALLALYRISQEALTNAARHAQARRVEMRLTVVCPPHAGGPVQVEWVVTDDGQGVPDLQAAFRRGNGLAGIKERLWALGADLQIGPSGRVVGQGAGCRLAAAVFLPAVCDDEPHA
jgi:two-component system sensor histidine kinase UhpB